MIIPIRKFGGLITNPQGEDIPDFSSEFNLNVDPETQSQLRGITSSATATAAAGVAITDAYESDFIDADISGTKVRDLVYIDREDNDITIIGDFYEALPITIASSTDASPIVVTTSTNHNLDWIDSTPDIGQKITIANHTTNVAANGTNYAKRLTPTTFELYSDEALTSAVAGSGAGAGSAGTVGGLTYYDIRQSETKPECVKTFGNAAQIGLGNLNTGRIPVTVYRQVGTKDFFDYSAGVSGYQEDPGIKIASGALKNSSSAGGIYVSATAMNAAAGYFQPNIMYEWGVSLVYDGIQESDLIVASAQDSNAAVCSYVTLTITGHTLLTGVNLDKRITAIKIYRAESSDSNPENLGLHKLVKTIGINETLWTNASPHVTYSYQDDGGYPEGGQTYEEETGIPETLAYQYVNYSINEVGGGYHWVGKAIITDTNKGLESADWNRYIFRSQKFRPNMFNWVEGNHLVLPEIPVDMKFYEDKLYVFTENKVYRINPETLIVEDQFEGAGVSKRGGVVATEFGLFFCNLNGAYRLLSTQFNTEIKPITDNIKVSLGNYSLSWGVFAARSLNVSGAYDFGRIIAGYLPDKRSVVFIGQNTTATTLAYIYYLPTEEWFIWDFGSRLLDINSGLVTGKDGELYWSGTTTLNKLLGLTTAWESVSWVSKEFTLGDPSQNKSWKKLIWDGTASTGAIAVKYNTNGGNPVSGSTATSDTYINIYKKTMQIYITTTKDATVDSLDILVRKLRGER